MSPPIDPPVVCEEPEVPTYPCRACGGWTVEEELLAQLCPDCQECMTAHTEGTPCESL